MTKARFALSSLVALATCTASYAQSYLVNWGGQYVTASTDLNNKNANTSGNTRGTNFSLSTVLSPTAGYSGTSATFYGGGATTLVSGTSLGWQDFRIQNQGSADMIDFTVNSGVDQHTMSVALVWQKPDFLTSTATVIFDPSSQLRTVINNASTGPMSDAQARWLVMDGGTMYLSQVVFAPTAGTYTYNPFVDGFSDGSWAPYTPSGLNTNFDQVAATFGTHKFTDISGVGIYFEHDVPRENMHWSIEGFSATAAVPEPATVFLLGSVVAGAAGFQFNRYRRNRKQANTTL